MKETPVPPDSEPAPTKNEVGYPDCLPKDSRAPQWWYNCFQQGHHGLSIYEIEWAYEAYLRFCPKTTGSPHTGESSNQESVKAHPRLIALAEAIAVLSAAPEVDDERYESLPCPFCGKSEFKIETSDQHREYRVRCLHCEALGPATGCTHDAVRYWNDRGQEPSA